MTERQGGLRLPAGHRASAATPTSTATSSPRWTRRAWSSTSASTAAAWWPTTSSTTCAGRSLNYWPTRDGEDYTTPGGAIFGPKVMIINE